MSHQFIIPNVSMLAVIKFSYCDAKSLTGPLLVPQFPRENTSKTNCKKKMRRLLAQHYSTKNVLMSVKVQNERKNISERNITKKTDQSELYFLLFLSVLPINELF